MPDHDDPKASTTLLVGAIGTLFLVVTVFGLESMFGRWEERELERKALSHSPEELDLLRAEQLGQLEGYRWIDESTGKVAIPIERAMELVVEERQ